jgi:hypothetical protein
VTPSGRVEFISLAAVHSPMDDDSPPPPSDLLARIANLERDVRDLRARVASLEKLLGPRMENRVDTDVVRQKVSYDWQSPR